LLGIQIWPPDQALVPPTVAAFLYAAAAQRHLPLAHVCTILNCTISYLSNEIRMSSDGKSRVKKWAPAARPEWVRKMNEEGACLDLKSVVPLDENSLLSHAKANTGLSDFGSDDWYEPFKILIKALNEESELTLMGRLMTRSDLLMNLEARLRVEDTYKRNPEIDAEELRAPILIVGSGRSGTSAILNLLALDPDNGTAKHWEALFPAPPPEAATYATDPRIAIAHQRMDQWNRVAPEIASMHEFAGHIPTELIQVEAMAFQSNGWIDLYGFVPTYDAFLAKRPFTNSLRYAKRVLKLLQWKNPHRRWVLKSPDTMRYLTDVFEVFPDLQLVWMHRDPIKCVASVVSLVGTLFWMRSDQPLSEQAISQLTNPAGLAGFFDHVLNQLERGEIPVQSLHNIQYLDFVKDPLGVVEKLYLELNVPLTAAARTAMQEYLTAHPRESRPAHRYRVAEGGDLSAERKLFERYQQHFKVPSEM
jgi:Sulfotransferase family